MFEVLAVSAVLATAVGAPAVTAPTLRLPSDVRPVRQAVELTVDPAGEIFTGVIDVALETTNDTSLVWLNALGLNVTTAQLGPEGHLRPARIVATGDDFIGFVPETPLVRGKARLVASFEGKLSRVQNDGLFAMKEGDDWYAFSQFEPISARRAFPCFDEPSYKIPWEVTLRVPHGGLALSNAPVASTARDGDRDVVRFAPTQPLPSYLVAVAVGPFDVVDLGAAGRNKTPTRLVVPKGRAPDTAWARESTPRLLTLLEDYFDRPYPYEKLDQVAIPGVGYAMEHPGLVTYGMGLMVKREKEESIVSRRFWASVCAHELAHQWFGDLVTMAWWDDTWLNESFASWMGQKVTEQFRPDWGIATERVAARSDALQRDSFASARRIRQPIESKDDINNAFDGITYAKGEAVLEMSEAWLGEKAFRRGVQMYLERHAWGNATASDFLSALSSATGRDAAAVLSTFLDQTGAPVVSTETRCDGAPRLVLSQRPYHALGSSVVSKSWNVPVCVEAAGREHGPSCALLVHTSGDIPLDGTGCPDWAYANAGGAGYYRTLVVADEARRSLASGRLSAAERVALAGDLDALVASGDVPARDGLGLLPVLAQDPERQVVNSAIALAGGLSPSVDDALLPRYEAFIRSLFGSRARQLGVSPRPGESEDARLLRPSLVSAVGGLGRDARLQEETTSLVRQWLDDPSVIDPDMLETVLAVGVEFADRGLVERLTSEVLKTSDREQRQRLIGALGSLRDPGLVGEALQLTVDERLDARESVQLLWAFGSHRETRRTAFDFLKSHYDALTRRLPAGMFSPIMYFPWVAAGLCTSDARREMETFFAPRATTIEGAARVLDQALERVDQCVARKKVEGPSIAAFLQSTDTTADSR